MTKGLDLLPEEAKYILKIIHKKGPITFSDLRLFSNLSFERLQCTLDKLIQDRLIVKIDENNIVFYKIDARDRYFIGIEISRLVTRVVITNMKMEIIKNQQFPMFEQCSPKVTVDMIYTIINNMLNCLSIKMADIQGVGLGAIGPIDLTKGVIIKPSYMAAPEWKSLVPIKKMLENKLNKRITVDYGANMAALAEYYYGVGKGFERVAYYKCSIGVRKAFINEGRIIRHINDSEDFDKYDLGDNCPCDLSGSFDCYSTVNIIIEKYKSELIKRNVRTNKAIDKITLNDIINAAETNEELAREVLNNGATVFSDRLVRHIKELKPELAIVSSDLVIQSNLFYKSCIEIASMKLLEAGIKIKFHQGGSFGENAIAIGAAASALENILK